MDLRKDFWQPVYVLTNAEKDGFRPFLNFPALHACPEPSRERVDGKQKAPAFRAGAYDEKIQRRP